MPNVPGTCRRFPISGRGHRASLETKSRTADTPACPVMCECEFATTPGRLAQLVRAPRLHRGGRGFESLSAHYLRPKVRALIRRTPQNIDFCGVLCFGGFVCFCCFACLVCHRTRFRCRVGEHTNVAILLRRDEPLSFRMQLAVQTALCVCVLEV